MDSYIRTIEELLSEIEKTSPDVVVMDLDLYSKFDGIETSGKIRSQLVVSVIYFFVS